MNKTQFCYLYFVRTSKGDFGVKAPPQVCQQNIFGILVAPQINPLHTNNRPGLPVYHGVADQLYSSVVTTALYVTLVRKYWY